MPPDGAFGYVVDDEAAVRRSLALLLGAAGYAVETFAGGEDFLRRATPDLPFGCVVLDVRMPNTDGIAVLREMSSRGLRHPIVVITAHGDVPLAVRMMKAGACDMLQKPFAGEALLDAAAAALARRDEAEAAQAAQRRLARLSPRETEVLQGMVAGHQNKVIAQRLGISPRTVEIHRANLMTKLEARSLSEAVRMAMTVGGATLHRLGSAPPPPPAGAPIHPIRRPG
ncbi:response regulator transcription factor [Falsiroseomonas selenitidurans]|uniref:Response regulator n=1 Tax=Falsiroseomonas selenitidurans TaxID=2716335 RepID=A0ABX1DX61_9PROT|nr:response regulator [Falsiroseomonas selenitidurans]NKC29478.1 response regulator [Falsiroseomonas selenitidurans]